MNIKGKNILITGATGFVGSNLARHFLKKGANVSIIKRQKSDIWRIKEIINQVSVYNVDLLDYVKVNTTVKRIKADVVLHTATYGGHVAQDDPTQIIKTNFDATVNLLNTCSKNGFGVFINTGSSSEYGIKDSPMQESDLLEPVTLYGVSKASASIYCQYIAKKRNLPIVTLRLFSPYGYFDDVSRAVSQIIISCLKNKPVKISSPNAVRDFVFIDDVVSSYEKVLRISNNIRGCIFNIGSGQQHTIKKIAEKIARSIDGSILFKYQRMLSARVEPKNWLADISKSSEVLNWKPKVDLNEGLIKTIDWFKDNKRLYS